jgi:hypothetical protein
VRPTLSLADLRASLKPKSPPSLPPMLAASSAPSADTLETVPRDSVILREDGAFVMRINDDAKAERVAVKVSEASGDQIAVTGELQSGDRVAVRGAEALVDGELVDIQSET